MLNVRHNLSLLSLALILVCGIGCSSSSSNGPPVPPGPKAKVTGKVTANGKPITAGILVLDSGGGNTISAPVKPDGTFELAGANGSEVPVGTYKVGITPPPAPAPPPGQMSTLAKIEGLDDRFYNPMTSGVSVEVKQGEQKLEIVLQ